MSKKPLKPFLILLVVTLCCVSMFALAACDDKTDNTPAQNTPEIPDHSVLFKFIPNNDGKSYMARFMPELDPSSPYKHLIPNDLYIPSSYGGFPVTAFLIGDTKNLTTTDIGRINNIHIPNTITGGFIYFIGDSSVAPQFTLKGYSVEKPNSVVTTYSYENSKFKINDEYYTYLTNYIDSSSYKEIYNNYYRYVRRGLILIPYDAK